MLSLAVVSVLLASCVVLVFRFINKTYESAIFGVYQRRNKYFWFKFGFMYCFLRAKQFYVYLKGLLAVELGYSYDGTVHVHEDDLVLEQKYDLGSYAQSVDAIYFNGTAKDGTAVICGVARRPEKMCDAFMYLKLSDEELLLSPALPDSRIEQTEEQAGEYSAGDIHATDVIPMRTWKLAYKGEMKVKNVPEKTVNVQMDLTWSAAWPAFNFDVDMSPRSTAKDLAKEPWTADYFRLLKKFHQTHYEQIGFLTGSAMVDGKQIDINMPCVRDHSFGKIREWRNFHRYILHIIYLENGDCMQVGTVSQPLIASHLTIGYLCRKSDQAVLPVKLCDFKLWQHGENQILPKDYGFTFLAGGERYDVKLKVHDEDFFYIGKAREAKIYERWASAEVNGVKGWGCLEWQYNNVVAAIKQ